MIKPVPKTVILQAHEVAEEPAQIIITWNFEICRLCGSTDTAHNLKPEEFDHDFMGELKRANGN